MNDNVLVGKEKYKIVTTIGIGGSSEVFLARDNAIGKRWAVKKIYRQNGLATMLAKREVDMLKAIDYPMFPRITDAWQDDEAIYIVSDYVEGITLDKAIDKYGISMRQSVGWALQIARALEYLHSLNPPILYLDLKPENIIVKADGKLMLIDFGIACKITCSQLPIGTPGYAAPEQFREETVLTEKTDIFALGMTYYYMRTGRSPNRNINEAHKEIIRSKLSRKEKTFLLKCTANESERRYQSIENCYFHLKHIIFNPFKVKHFLYFAGIIIFINAFKTYGNQVFASNNRKLEASKEMLQEANKYLEDGDYTVEGIKIITSYINSGCLDEQTEQDFIWEAAMNYFEVQKDYRNAYKYFVRLDKNAYPEISYLIRLCELQMKFDVDRNEMKECVQKFYGMNSKESDCYKKYENILLISYCFEECEENSIVGIKKAITVVEAGLNSLEKQVSGEDDIDMRMGRLDEKYRSRLDNLYRRAKIRIVTEEGHE